MNYETIKALARQQGISISDLCALAPNNDPFYTGRPSELAAARWFADLWRRFGYGDGVHLRRVHYQVVSQKPPVTKPNGEVYENTEADWNYLCNAGKWARYLGYVSPGAFVDRRNPEAKIFTDWTQWDDPTPRYSISGGWDEYGYELPDLPTLGELPYELPDPARFAAGGYGDLKQPYHVEVWCEKTTMNDVLEPLCRRYRANLVTGAGEMSITAVVDFMRRVRRAGRPARILYVSDFDPAGLGMPISVARKIEFFQREEGFDDLDIRLQPIVLTGEQVEAYDLPRVPVKDSDRRKANWEADHGKGQVELDALEALHPGVLARVTERAILDYHDPSLQGRADQVKAELEEDLDGYRDGVVERYRSELDALEADYQTLLDGFEGTRAEFDELVADFRPRIDAYQERLDDIRERGRRLYELIDRELDAVGVDLDDYALPEPDLPDESDGLLYDSRRSYLDQLEVYKAHRHGDDGAG